ncbi:hypothetical protein EMCG_08240 [[Emmonsia] crescens]|uniref:Uncharacterized protein n=1 Tax=[Emmonsia] crescens TaxID=73230 RepID=A0A0G2I6C5_9EURO|nr:hypothetical protein EMCG_08240 [Emmonsia crescens UAMH 3008]
MGNSETHKYQGERRVGWRVVGPGGRISKISLFEVSGEEPASKGPQVSKSRLLQDRIKMRGLKLQILAVPQFLSVTKSADCVAGARLLADSDGIVIERSVDLTYRV